MFLLKVHRSESDVMKYMGVSQPKNMEKITQNHPFVYTVWNNYIFSPSILGFSPLFLETPIYSYSSDVKIQDGHMLGVIFFRISHVDLGCD